MNIDEYIRFDDLNKQFAIESGTYSYCDVARVSVLNEKAKYKGKGVPFTAILPSGHCQLEFYKIHIYLLELRLY